MKFLILILSLTLIPTISRAQLTNVISRSYVGTTEYQFALSKSELANASDWDPTEGVPRLSPGKASSLAKDYLDRITKGKTSVGGKRIAWQLNSITLQKASIDPERWVYKVGFVEDVSAYGSWAGLVANFDVIVYLSGNIIDPVVSSQK
jgi:hypothetical protein